MTGPPARRPGRRKGAGDSREAILDAARSEFAARGYDGATLRGIARVAGFDPALVHHFFASKEALFTEAMQFPVEPSAVTPALLAQGVDQLGERLLRMLLEVWESPETSGRMLAVIKGAVTSEAAAGLLRQFLTREVLGRLAAAVGLPDAELRATLAGSQIVGLAFARYVVKVEPLASLDREDVIALVGPTLDRYLTGEWEAPAPCGPSPS